MFNKQNQSINSGAVILKNRTLKASSKYSVTLALVMRKTVL